MTAKDRQWEMEALARLFSLKTSLLNEMRFDYVFFDTSPGLQYSSINAIVSADIVLVVTSTDKSDVEGIQRMIHDLYELFEKKTGIIMNKVPLELQENNTIKLETHNLPVVGVVPCSCDILDAGGNCLFASEKPNHPFTKTLQEIASTLTVMRSYSTRLTPKLLKLEKCHSDYASAFFHHRM